VAGLQGNIDQGVKWNAAWVERTLGVYEGLTRRAVASGARLVVWPETAVPGVIEGQPELRGRLAALARASGVTLVVGGVGIDPQPGRNGWSYFDSAFVISAQGAWIDRYDKTHLVPFGEYIPLRWLWGSLLEAVARGIAPADISAGEAPRAVEIPLPPPRAVEAGPPPPRVLRAGIPVCYELLFPQLVRHFAADGARVLLAITNDAWYGRTGAPYQFMAMTQLRSAETGLWTVRAANTGVSAVIDAGGGVRERTPLFEPGSVLADVPLSPPGATTFYVRHGEWFATLCWLGLAAVAGEAAARSRRARRRASPDERRAES
jgi:apolipoprotein N-acyltransferase